MCEVGPATDATTDEGELGRREQGGGAWEEGRRAAGWVRWLVGNGAEGVVSARGEHVRGGAQGSAWWAVSCLERVKARAVARWEWDPGGERA